MLRKPEEPGGGCAHPSVLSASLAGHESGLRDISSLSPAPPVACGPCRSSVLLWGFVTSQEASEVPVLAPLPAPVRQGGTAWVLQREPRPRPRRCLSLRILQQETSLAAQRAGASCGPHGDRGFGSPTPSSEIRSGEVRGAGLRLRLSRPPPQVSFTPRTSTPGTWGWGPGLAVSPGCGVQPECGRGFPTSQESLSSRW